MSFLTRFINQLAAHGVDTAVNTIEEQVPGMTTGQVEDKLTEYTRTLAREMAQRAQQGQQVPAEIIAAALTAGYCAAELRNRQQRDRT